MAISSIGRLSKKHMTKIAPHHEFVMSSRFAGGPLPEILQIALASAKIRHGLGLGQASVARMKRRHLRRRAIRGDPPHMTATP
jgi:hypothetical protein